MTSSYPPPKDVGTGVRGNVPLLFSLSFFSHKDFVKTNFLAWKQKMFSKTRGLRVHA
jgi:hypothetical protein